jgi:hypothetical protein
VHWGPGEALIRKDNKMRILPVYKGWTVDVRLKQFRKIVKQSKSFAGIEYLDFDTDKGDIILTRYIKSLKIDSSEFKEVCNIF